MRHISVLALLALAVTACDDTTFRIDPMLVHDTVEVFVPTAANAGQPTALDITSANQFIRGPRFPERAADAEQWDFTPRLRDGEIALLPASLLGFTGSRAALSPPLAGQTFDAVREAAGNVLRADSARVMRVGQVHVARSRDLGGSFGSCQQFAKLQPLVVDPAAGRLVLQITTNERCGDFRLVMED